jgi:hypothetical protein
VNGLRKRPVGSSTYKVEPSARADSPASRTRLAIKSRSTRPENMLFSGIPNRVEDGTAIGGACLILAARARPGTRIAMIHRTRWIAQLRYSSREYLGSLPLFLVRQSALRGCRRMFLYQCVPDPCTGSRTRLSVQHEPDRNRDFLSGFASNNADLDLAVSGEAFFEWFS